MIITMYWKIWHQDIIFKKTTYFLWSGFRKLQNKRNWDWHIFIFWNMFHCNLNFKKKNLKSHMCDWYYYKYQWYAKMKNMFTYFLLLLIISEHELHRSIKSCEYVLWPISSSFIVLWDSHLFASWCLQQSLNQ